MKVEMQRLFYLLIAVFGLFSGGVILGNSFAMKAGNGRMFAVFAALGFALIGASFAAVLS